MFCPEVIRVSLQAQRITVLIGLAGRKLREIFGRASFHTASTLNRSLKRPLTAGTAKARFRAGCQLRIPTRCGPSARHVMLTYA